VNLQISFAYLPVYLQTLRIHKGDEVSRLSKNNFITFDNNWTKWQNFKDLFKTLKHNVDKISPAREMQYFKSCFIVKAAKVITKIKIRTEGYSSAWDQLPEYYYYYNSQLLLRSYMQFFFKTLRIFSPISKDIISILNIFAVSSLLSAMDNYETIICSSMR